MRVKGLGFRAGMGDLFLNCRFLYIKFFVGFLGFRAWMGDSHLPRREMVWCLGSRVYGLGSWVWGRTSPDLKWTFGWKMRVMNRALGGYYRLGFRVLGSHLPRLEVDVWVEDAGYESRLGWLHRVCLCHIELHLRLRFRL
jgi:hypothetical protein